MQMKIHGYSREELMRMDIAELRGILHERTHHTIEVFLYRVLSGKIKKPNDFGKQVEFLMDIWKERGFQTNTPDLKWCLKNLEIANMLNEQKEVDLGTRLPEKFNNNEIKTVKKLLYERRSIRQFKNKKVPDGLIKEILYAGLMAPQGCNVDSRRFIVLNNPEEWKLVQSDLPIENCIMIVLCQDMRVYYKLRFDKIFPQNIYYDIACSADHMCLMASALGLGACWLTHGEETQRKIRHYFGLPDTFVSRCHIIVGWPDEAPIKSQRMSLNDAIIKKKVDIV